MHNGTLVKWELCRLIKRMGIQRKYVFLLLLRAPFDALRAWMLADLMKTVFFCLETNDKNKLSAVCVIYGLICALLFFYNGTIWSLYAVFSAKAEARLQKMMLQKMMSLPLKRVGGHFSAQWITKLNSDIQAANRMMKIIGNLQSSQSAEGIAEMTDEERAWLLVKLVCIEDVRAQKALSEALWL